MHALPWYIKVITKYGLGYFDGRLSRLIVGSDGATKILEADNSFKPKIVIVGRQFYSERLNKYPIENARELSKYFSLNNKSFYYLVNQVSDGCSWINEWEFSNEIPKAVIYLPESLLLANTIDLNNSIQVSAPNDLFVGRIKNGLSSLISTPLINNLSLYNLSLGIVDGELSEPLNSREYFCRLLSGLSKIQYRQLSAFTRFNLESNMFDGVSIKQVGISVALLVSAYLAFSSGYLVYQEKKLVNRLEFNNELVNEAITIENTYNDINSTVFKLASFVDGLESVDAVWRVILPLFREANISQLSYTQGRLIVAGETEKSTDLLTKLTKVEYVKDAKFDSPIRLYRGKEQFSISFILDKDIAPEEK